MNEWVVESDAIVNLLRRLVSDGRTLRPTHRFHTLRALAPLGPYGKFGVWMQGPDYVQWHGAYEILSELAELREIAAELQGEHAR